MKANVTALTLASYLSMLFLGIAGAIVGAAARNINLTPFEIGLFLTIQNIGFMIGVVVTGSLADSYEKPRLLLVASLILAFSFFTFYLTGIIWINLALMLLIGIGIGSYEGVTDPMLLDMHTKRQSLQININHFFVTFGAIIITVYLIYLQMDWRQSLTQSAIVVLILAVVYAIFRLPIKERPKEDYFKRIRILSRDRLVVAFFIATIAAVGVEVGSIGILTTYLMDLRDFTQVTSKIGLIVFLSGIALGRVTIGLLPQTKAQISRFILILFGFSVVTFSVLYLLSLDQVTYAAIFVAGLSISASLPLMIALAGMSYPDLAGTVIGSIKVAIPIGGILIPFVMSLISRQLSFQAALVIFPSVLLIAFVVLWLQLRRGAEAVEPSTAD